MKMKHRKQMYKPMLRAGIIFVPILFFAASAFAQTDSYLDTLDLKDGATAFKLPKELGEISGLTISPDNEIFALGDEFGIIFEIDPTSGKMKRAFALGEPTISGDFEGIAWADNKIYLIESGGRIFEAPVGENRERVIYNSYGTGIGKSCEVEGLAFDVEARDLLILCKTPRIRAFRAKIVIYRWGLDDHEIPAEPALIIDLEPIRDRIDEKNLHPSGLAIDLRTGHLIIVASQENRILEFSPFGELIAIRKLSKRRHRQPEGLTILQDGTLVIADEGGSKKGRITLYAPVSD